MRDLTNARFLVASSTDGDHFALTQAGDDLDVAQRAYLNAIAANGTTDVHLVERVPVILHDGRGAQGVMLRLAERLAWCQRVMIESGLTARDVARHVRFGEASIVAMFSGEEVKARWVDELVEALEEITEAD
ncbi:MAG: hypothetical protein CMM84_03585 [Rhodothermaceae bacterium]|nr:hypothetical protein [Rhodothermaceae bacterium]MBC15300.1 hypothetical protein [Rhodothermaceae bacterium]